MTRRHRSEYPPAMQEIGDLLELWDADGHLIDCPEWVGDSPERQAIAPFVLMTIGRTPPQDSKP